MCADYDNEDPSIHLEYFGTNVYQLKIIEADWAAEPLPLAIYHENIASRAFAW